MALERALYIVVKDDENDGRRLFLPLKNNIGDDKNGLAFSLQKHNLASGIETCMVTWEAGKVTVSADEALANQGAGERSRTDEAKDFLLKELTDRYGNRIKVPSKQVERDAEGNGISVATLRIAKKALGVEAIKEGKPGDPTDPGKWYWRLPESAGAPKMIKNDEDANDKSISTFGVDEHLRDTKER